MINSSNTPGILLSSIIGGSSVLVVTLLPDLMSGIILALLLGFIIGNTIRIPEGYTAGIDFSGGKLLEFSILFLAFSINYNHLGELGIDTLVIVMLLVFIMIFLTVFIGKRMNDSGYTGILIGFGTSICGSSAIAALAPSITKNKNEIGVAMAVVNVLGGIGMILLPTIIQYIQLDTNQAGTIIGGTLHSVGNVVGASYILSDSVGESALTIKLTRVAMLSPGLIIMNYLIKKDEVKNWKSYLTLPWYLWCFILITILTSVYSFPTWFLESMNYIGKFILAIAMAAIGLNISFRNLITSGKRGLLIGTVMFALILTVLGVLMFLQYFLN